MTTAFASGPWARVHRCCHQRDGKTQNKIRPGRVDIRRDQAIM